MTGVYNGVAIPVLEDILAYATPAVVAPPAGFSVDAGPPKKIKGTFQAARKYIRPMASATTQSKKWTVLKTQVDLSGAAGSEVVEFVTSFGSTAIGLYLEWVLQSATTAKIRLGKKAISPARTPLGTSSTTYTQGTTITIRIETNGTTVKVWINGITDGELEIDVAEVQGWANLYLVTPDDSSFVHWWWLMAQRGGTSGADRPGVSVEGVLCNPNADYGSPHNDYGGETGSGEDCADTAKGIWSNWDDYTSSTTHDGTSTYNCLQGGNAGDEVSVLSTVAVTRTPDGVTTRAFGAGSIVAKTVDSDTILIDEDGNQDTQVNENLGATTFVVIARDWNDPPDGTWADFVSSSTFNHASAVHQLSVGLQSPDTNTANDLWTAIAVIVGSIDNDPEPVTENRRRAAAQVV